MDRVLASSKEDSGFVPWPGQNTRLQWGRQWVRALIWSSHSPPVRKTVGSCPGLIKPRASSEEDWVRALVWSNHSPPVRMTVGSCPGLVKPLASSEEDSGFVPWSGQTTRLQ